MKIRDSILIVLAAGVLATSGALIGFASSKISTIESSTSHASNNVLVAQANKDLENIAIGLRDSVDAQMAEQYQLVKSWAMTPSLVEAARRGNATTKEALFEAWSAETGRQFAKDQAVGDGNPKNDILPVASEFLVDLSAQYPYPELFATDGRGYIVAASVVTGDFDQGPDDWRFFSRDGFKKFKPEPGGEGWYRMTMESQKGQYVGPVSWDESSKTWGIEIVSQIHDPQSKAVLGVLKGVFNYGQFINRSVRAEQLDIYEVKVVAEDGTIVATSLDAKEKVNNKNVHVSKMAYVGAVKGGQTVGSVNEPEVDENGETVYEGFAMSRDVNHHVVVVSKKKIAVDGPIEAFTNGLRSQIRSAATQLQQQMVLVGIMAGIIVFLLAFFILRARISVPIQKLTRVSEKLSKGEIEGLALDVSGDDEIGQFGESFKGVLAAFQMLMDDAEQKRK